MNTPTASRRSVAVALSYVAVTSLLGCTEPTSAPVTSASETGGLHLCADTSGVSCPETATYFPSTAALVPEGTTYTDRIPETLDLATWASEYTQSFTALLLPASSFNTVAQTDKIHGGDWVPDGSYAFGISTVFHKTYDPSQAGGDPDFSCRRTEDGGVGQAPCIEAFAASQWAGGLSSLLRAREMSGHDFNDANGTMTRELLSLRGVIQWYQNRFAAAVANGRAQVPSYALMMLNDLHQQFPNNPVYVEMMGQFIDYLKHSMFVENVGPRSFSYWNNLMIFSAGGGDEDYGGFQNRHYIEAYAQANTALPLLEWYLATGDPDAFDLAAKANDFIRNYHKREFRALTPQDTHVGRGSVTVMADIGPRDRGMTVHLFKDGVHVQTFTGAPYIWQWDTTNESEGAHVIKAVGYDDQGRVPAVDLSVVVDSAAAPGRLMFLMDDDLTFWDNPDPAKYNADGPVAFVGATIIDAAEAFALEAIARVKRAQPGDDVIASENVNRAKQFYDFLKRRGSIRGVLGNFGGAGATGEMIRLATYLAKLSRFYPNELGAQSDYWEDIERWVRNAAAEMRITADIAAAYIPDGASGDPRFDRIGSRSVGAFQSDGGHAFVIPRFLWVDNNDGFWLMRGLYDAWKESIQIPDGAVVHLLLNRAHRYFDVHSELPYRGRVRVRMHQDNGALPYLAIRIPSYALSGPIYITRNGTPLTFGSDWVFSGRYAIIPSPAASATYEVSFTQAVSRVGFVQLAPQNQFWLNSSFGGTLTPEQPVGYVGTFIGDTLVDVDHRPALVDQWGVPGIPRYQRQGLAALVEGNAATDHAPGERSVTRFVTGTFEAPEPPPPQPPPPLYAYSSPILIAVTGNAVMLGDLDGDGWKDLLQTAADGTVMVQRNVGNLSFGTPHVVARTGWRVMFADLNGDNLDDLIQQGPNGTAIAQINQGNLAFADPVTIAVTGNAVMVADLNGDGLADLTQRTLDGRVLAQLNHGSLTFSAPVGLGQTGNEVDVVEVSGDRYAEIVQLAVNADTNYYYAQINQGGLSFSGLHFIGATGNRLQFADLNHDSLPDLIQQNPAGQVFVQLRQ